MASQPFENLKLTLARRLNPAGQAVRLAQAPMKKTLKYGGPLLGGLALYFYGLGKAAFTGFLVGASIGGAVGAGVGGYIGLQIALATGPFAPIVGIVTVPLGAAAGGTIGAAIGGTAGGLIGLGMASGSSALVSMGTGSALGGLIGGYLGFGAGAAAGTALAAGCIYITAGLCSPFAPFIVAGSTFTGTAVGATLGALAGAAIGYGFDKYVAAPLTKAFKGAVSSVKGGVSSGASTGAGIPSGITSWTSSAASNAGHFVSGVVSGAGSFVANGFTGLLGHAANLLGEAGGLFTKILGTSTAEAASVGAAATPIATAVGTVTATTILVGSIILPAAFFSAEREGEAPPAPGQNQYFTLTKTAAPNAFPNPASGSQQVLFTITLTAKDTRLTSVQLVDQIRGGAGGSITLPSPSVSCTVPIEPNTTCTQTFTVGIDSRFNDSIVTNTVTATVTPEGQSTQTSTVVANVRVGSPSTQCPTSWPTTGFITQGPEGHFNDPVTGQPSGHGDYGYEALDIGAVFGTTVYATIDGIVERLSQGRGGPGDQRMRIVPNNCSGLTTVNYWHLSAISVSNASTVRKGDIIGQSGDYFGAAHIHYQFNETNNRSFRIERPNVPVTVPKTCVGAPACGNVNTTAP